MKAPFLEVTYRHGRPLAAYLYLPRRECDRSARTGDAGDGMLVDFAADGRVIGVDITTPSRFDLDRLNGVLATFGCASVAGSDVAPITGA